MLTDSFLEISYSGISRCTDPDVGYTIDTNFFGVDIGRDTARVVVKALAGSLIVNAIAAGAAGVRPITSFDRPDLARSASSLPSSHGSVPAESWRLCVLDRTNMSLSH